MNITQAMTAGPPSKILVPTDLTFESRTVIEYAMMLGQPLHADVDLLHVQRSTQIEEPPTFAWFDPIGEYPLYWAPAASDLQREEVLTEFAHSEAGHKMVECLKDLKWDVEAHGRIAFGDPSDPADTIVAVAADAEYDLIVMATHGRGHLFAHGVAEKVVRRAPCPVVTIRIPPE